MAPNGQLMRGPAVDNPQDACCCFAGCEAKVATSWNWRVSKDGERIDWLHFTAVQNSAHKDFRRLDKASCHVYNGNPSSLPDTAAQPKPPAVASTPQPARSSVRMRTSTPRGAGYLQATMASASKVVSTASSRMVQKRPKTSKFVFTEAAEDDGGSGDDEDDDNEAPDVEELINDVSKESEPVTPLDVCAALALAEAPQFWEGSDLQDGGMVQEQSPSSSPVRRPPAAIVTLLCHLPPLSRMRMRIRPHQQQEVRRRCLAQALGPSPPAAASAVVTLN